MNKHIAYSVLLAALLVGGCNSGSSSSNNSNNNGVGTKVASVNHDKSMTFEKYVYNDNIKKREEYRLRSIKIENDPSIEKKVISGNLFSGYIEGARVCLDLDNNNKCDYNEPLTVSDSTGDFEFKVPMVAEIKEAIDNKPVVVLASRGEDINTGSTFMALLKAQLPQEQGGKYSVNLTPLETLAVTKAQKVSLKKGVEGKIISVDKTAFEAELNKVKQDAKELMGIDDLSDAYKQNLIFQKTAQILSSTGNNQTPQDSLDSLMKTYEDLPFIYDDDDSDDYDTVLGNLGTKNPTLQKAVKQAKAVNLKLENLLSSSGGFSLEDKTNRENLVTVLDSYVDEAKIHFRNKPNDELPENVADLGTSDGLKDTAIKIKLKQIGLKSTDITGELIQAVKDSNLALTDLEDLEKVEKATGLEKIAKLLKAKQNINTQLYVLKSFVTKDLMKLKIFYSLPLDADSQAKLANIDDVKQSITILGLNYTLASVEYDSQENSSTLNFSTPCVFAGKEAQVYINALALADENGGYARVEPNPAYIETIRSIPLTGQKVAFTKGDDGSYQYGENLNYSTTSGQGVSSQIANLQWQDIPFVDGTNDNITYAQAKLYCEHADTYGYDDWRLPNVKEAVTTTSLDGTSVFAQYPVSGAIHVLTQNPLDKTMAVQKDSQVANLVNVDDSFSYTTAGQYGVRCVRDINTGSLFPHKAKDNIVQAEKNKTSYDPTLRIMFQDEPYTELGDSVVEDNKNIGKYGDRDYAISYCESLNTKNFAGYSNWRLPNANEIFFTLNGEGSETFQNRIPSFGYYITSSTSYFGETRLSWFTGNYYVRKYIDSRDKGYIRCVRNMDETSLKTAAEANGPATIIGDRKFVVGDDKTLNITVPAYIFTPYAGISLRKEHDERLLPEQFEISNMYDDSVYYPHYTIKSLTKNGNPVNIDVVNLDKEGHLQKIEVESGYFDIYLERDLVLNRYGIPKFTTGDKLVMVINNGGYDVTINMTIGESGQATSGSSGAVTPAPEAKAPVLKELANPVEISQATGMRSDGNSNVIYIDPTGNVPPKAEYDIVEDKGSKAINNLEIVGGNEDGIFEAFKNQAAGYWGIRVKKDKLSNLPVKSFTLQVKASNGKDSNIINLSVNIFKAKAPNLKTGVVLNLADAGGYSWSGAKPTKDGRDVLFNFANSQNYSGKLTVIIESLDGFDDFKYSGESENYEVVPFYNYGTEYGIAVKDGKKRANESILVKVTGVADDGKEYSATTSVEITGAGSNEPIVKAKAPEFQKAVFGTDSWDKFQIRSSADIGDFVTNYNSKDVVRMNSIPDDTILSVEPAGVFDAVISDSPEGYINLKVKDPSQLNTTIFNEADNSRTFTITAQRDTVTVSATVKVKLESAGKPPVLEAPAQPALLNPTDPKFSFDNGDLGIFSVKIKTLENDSFIKDLGKPGIETLEIVSGNENEYFKLEKITYTSDHFYQLTVNRSKVEDIKAHKDETFVLRIKANNGSQDSNIIDYKIKLADTIQPPVVKDEVTIHLSNKQTDPNGWKAVKTFDDKLVLFALQGNYMDPKMNTLDYTKYRVGFVENSRGEYWQDPAKVTFSGSSTNYKVVRVTDPQASAGIVLQDGGSEVEEDIVITTTINIKGLGKASATTTVHIVP